MTPAPLTPIDLRMARLAATRFASGIRLDVVASAHQGPPADPDATEHVLEGVYFHRDDVLAIIQGYADQMTANGTMTTHVDRLREYFEGRTV